eukprot:6356496-Amphidinium_carterae.1
MEKCGNWLRRQAWRTIINEGRPIARPQEPIDQSGSLLPAEDMTRSGAQCEARTMLHALWRQRLTKFR